MSDMSFDRYQDDLEAIANSFKLERFALLGISGGAANAIAYAARHPERVTKLVISGGYALGRNKRSSAQTAEEAKAFITMLQSGWGDEQSPFWRATSSFFFRMPLLNKGNGTLIFSTPPTPPRAWFRRGMLLMISTSPRTLPA